MSTEAAASMEAEVQETHSRSTHVSPGSHLELRGNTLFNVLCAFAIEVHWYPLVPPVSTGRHPTTTRSSSRSPLAMGTERLLGTPRTVLFDAPFYT